MAFIYKISSLVTFLCVSFIMVSGLPLIQDNRLSDSHKISTRITQGVATSLFNEALKNDQEKPTLKRTRRFASVDLSTNNRTRYLQSKNSAFVCVFPNGTVFGRCPLKYFNLTLLQFQALNSSIIRIRSVQTGLYIGMNKRGRIVGMNEKDNGTLWLRTPEQNDFSSYQSVWHLENVRGSSNKYYLGFKLRGKPKNGKHTLPGMTSVQFVAFTLP